MQLSPRRYYLLKWRALEDVCERELALFFKQKQLAETATPLPAGFPGGSVLTAAGYVAIEDVQGAELDELVDVGLDEATAAQVIQAME